jgi:hypothetical protein
MEMMDVMDINLEVMLLMETSMELHNYVLEEASTGGLDEIILQQAMESRMEFYTFLHEA